MSAPEAVAQVMPGVDCTAIPDRAYDASKSKRGFDPYAWTRVIGPGCVKEKDLDWFAAPRSMVEALRLAYGEGWRIDVLPAGEDASTLFLLTHKWTGWRLMARMGTGTRIVADPMTVPPAPSPDTHPTTHGDGAVGSWCSHSSVAAGDDLRGATRRATSTAVRRRGWLARSLRDSTVATEDLRKMFAAVGVRPDQPHAAGDGLGYSHLLCGALIEVWLAENGYHGTDAAAIRTMVALRGLDVLNAYERSPVNRTTEEER